MKRQLPKRYHSQLRLWQSRSPITLLLAPPLLVQKLHRQAFPHPHQPIARLITVDDSHTLLKDLTLAWVVECNRRPSMVVEEISAHA
jgi:hypothetical protein